MSALKTENAPLIRSIKTNPEEFNRRLLWLYQNNQIVREAWFKIEDEYDEAIKSEQLTD